MGLKLLAGMRVLEIGETVAVAYAGKLLADLGAEVVTVEPPGGSRLRRLPPYYQGIPGPERSVMHTWLSANKRSITLDIEAEPGKAILRRLAKKMNVLVRTPAVSVDLAGLREANPDLTETTISPFGSDGPYAGYRANDLILFAMSGTSFYLSRPVEDPASTPPKQNPGFQAGLVAGLYAASATLWGVLASKRKGEGVLIDVSEWEVLTSLLYEQTGWLSDGTLTPDRRRVPGSVITVVGGLVWCLPCSDGWVLISPREDHQFKQWSEAIGEQEWASQPQFSTGKLRVQRFWEIYERSAAWTRRRKKGEVLAAAQERKVACFPVGQMADLPELEQLKHRGFWSEIPHPVIRGLKYPGLPINVEGVDNAPSGPAPLAGEHALEVCTDLGMSAEEIETLQQLSVAQP